MEQEKNVLLERIKRIEYDDDDAAGLQIREEGGQPDQNAHFY